ncbi:MAG: PQQ-binding-like beta-propeller repeat protein [Bacteroidales bacterium]
MKSTTLSIILLTLLYGSIEAQKINEWRPENRTGVSAETGLLKSWPAAGPTLLWANLDLAKGFSSPSFGTNTIYITGNKGSIGAEDILFALNMNGKILWQTAIGRAWTGSNPESRATPTVEGNRVYTCSGFGDLACIDGTTGKIIWSYKASELNKGTYGSWGIAESLLIDGNKIYFSPGGPETTTIALNKATGDVIWKSASLNDKPGYVSPILINYAGEKMVVNVSLGHVFGVDASNGEILWKVAHLASPGGSDLIKCVTPLFHDGRVYVTGGYDIGGMMIGIAKDGKSASVAWTDKVLDVHHGGVVLVNGYIYGSNWLNNGDGNWCCIDWNTGKKMWEEHWNCKGSIISAEGMLFIYEEKNGNVGLLKANPEKFDLVSSFKVTQGNTGPFWAHPVIHNGILYLRHTNALMAYNIKAK